MVNLSSSLSMFTSSSSSPSQISPWIVFAAGVGVGAFISYLIPSSPSALPPNAQPIECDDNFHSLFYSPGSSSAFPLGSGHPLTNTCDPATIKRLTIVHPEYRRLPLVSGSFANIIIYRHCNNII